MIIKESINLTNFTKIKIVYEGSGSPDDDHQIVGVELFVDDSDRPVIIIGRQVEADREVEG